MSKIEIGMQEAEWSQFFEMIQEECPHCTVENLVVINGNVSGYDMIRYSRVPPRESVAASRAGNNSFNASWRWLVLECRELKNGIIPEVHFRDGNPFVLYGEKRGNVCPAAPKGGDRAERRQTPALV